MPEDKLRPGRKGPKKKDNGGGKNNTASQLSVSGNDLADYSNYISNVRNVNKQIEEIHPEIKQVKLIITSSIVSPNDFSKKSLNVKYGDFLELSNGTVSDLKEVVNTCISKYSILEDQTKAVNRALFEDGADVMVIIPGHKINAIITGDDISGSDTENMTRISESISKSNLLENKGRFKLPNMDDDITITYDTESYKISPSNVLDLETIHDISVLSIPQVYADKLDDSCRRDCYLTSSSVRDLESIDENVLATYHTLKKRKKEPVLRIDGGSAIADGGNAFNMKVPASSMIALYTDDVSNHAGYIALIDEFGRIVVVDDGANSLFAQVSEHNVSASILGKVSTNLTSKKKAPKLKDMLSLTSQILYETIKSATDSSIYHTNYNMEEENTMTKMLLYRALKEQKTRIIFLPKEYVSYIAFDYRDNGSGKTLLEDISMLASFKSMLTLAEIYFNVNKAIPTTTAIVDIDDTDPNPFKTKEMMKALLQDANRGSIPWNKTSITEQGKWIQNAGMNIVYNHKSFANTKITYERDSTKMSYEIDSELKETIGKQILKSLGVSPSIIDDANNPDFASIAMLNNALSNKINNERQDILDAATSDRVRKLIRCDSSLIGSITRIVVDAKKEILKELNTIIPEGTAKVTELSSGLIEHITNDIIDAFTIEVPRAEGLDTENLKRAFDDYNESIETLLETLKGTIVIEEYADKKQIDLDAAIESIRLEYLLTWCEEHNYFTKLTKLLATTDKTEINNKIDEIVNNNKFIISLIKKASKGKKKLMDENDDEPEPEPSPDETEPSPDETEPSPDETDGGNDIIEEIE